MPTLQIPVDGMVHQHAPLTIARMLDVAVVDRNGLVLVPVPDVLAMMRLDAAADVVLAHHRGGATSALCVHDVVIGGDLFVHLHVRTRIGEDRAEVVARLWSPDAAPSAPVTALEAITFSSFVGSA